MHYPPFNPIDDDMRFIDLMCKYNVKTCIYGHLHGPNYLDIKNIEGVDINFYLVSCDYLNFQLLKLN